MSSAVTGKGVPVKVPSRSSRSSVLRLVRMAVAFVVVAGSLGLATVTATAQDGDSSCPSADAEGYADVNPEGTHADNITCLKELGIPAPGDAYRPGDDMTRSEMARFMARAYAVITGEEAEVAEHAFTDIAEDDPNADDIARIAGLGITNGVNPEGTLYAPDAPVIRGHMALFLTRLFTAAADRDADVADTEFTDTGELSEEQQAAIGQIFGLGVTTGTTDTTYSPGDNVTREQMGSFVARMYHALVAELAAQEAAAAAEAERLAALVPAGAPTGVMLTSNDDGTELAVSWTAPEDIGGSDITGYVVQWKSGDDDYSEDNQADATDAEATIGDLSSGVEYTVRVMAVNNGGNSEPSEEASATTSTVAAGAPSGVTIAISGDVGDALDVSWTAPEDSGTHDITGYVVQSKSGDDDYGDGVSTSDTSANFDGLTKGTSYTFRVAAVSDAGQGDWSDEASASPGTVPGSVGDVKVAPGNAAGTLVVTWTAPTDNGGTPITGYVVQWATGRDAASMARINDPTATSHTITGLKNNVAYRVHVQAVNGAGAGAVTAPEDSAQTAVRPSTSVGSGTVTVVLPGLATDADGFRAGGRFASVAWPTPPLGAKENILNYDIQRKCGKQEWPAVHVNDAAQRGFTQNHVDENAVQLLAGADALLGGAVGTNPGTLTNGEECTFRVRANTYVDLAGGIYGTKDPNEDTLVGAWATGTATPLGAPGTPVDATVEPAHQSLVVSWSPARTADLKVNNGGSPITGYKISWSSPTPVGSTTVSGTSHTITGLTNGLTYSVTIKAVNARGESVATTAVTGVPRGVPTAPTNVQVSQPPAPAPGALDLRGTQLIVTWSAPAANGTNPVTGYEVARQTSAIPGPGATCPTGVTANAVGGCPPGGWVASDGSNNGTRHVNTPIADADRGTSYNYRVRAVNGTDVLDKGPWSAFGSGTAADLPSDVDATTVEQDRGASSVTLTWTPPDDSGSKITHYLVRYARNQTGNEPWSSMRRVEATPLPNYTISGLTGGPHEIGITAVNAIGSSDETVVASQGADGSGLPAPSSVTAAPSAMTNTDGTRMDIAWSAVSNAKGYLVQSRDVADDSRTWNDVSPEPTVTDPVAATDTGVEIARTNYFKVRKHTITGLTAATTYVIRVQAVTQGLSGGQPAGPAIVGSPGFSAAVKAEGTPSSAPTGLEVAQPAKTTTMRVTWTALSVADATAQRVTGYQVTWYPALPQVPGARGSATVAADAASYDITNGTIGVGYTVVVQAVNHIGAGAPVTATHPVAAAG